VDSLRHGTWPAYRCGTSSVRRAKRHAYARPSAQTLGPHGHSAGHAQESPDVGSTANTNASAASPLPAPLGRSQRRSAPASRAGENVSQSHGSSPANPSAQVQATWTTCAPASSGRGFRKSGSRHRPAYPRHCSVSSHQWEPHPRRAGVSSVRRPRGPSAPGRGSLTRRSKGPPPARRLGREALRHIIRLAAKAPRRLRPLSSNVRRRKRRPLPISPDSPA
jgi:hypothetical protein